MIALLLLAALACQVPAVPGAPQPTPTHAPTMTIAPGALIFEDDFSDPGSGWERRAAAEGIMDYNAESYRIIANVPQTNFWSTAKRDLVDVRLEVDEGKLAGPDENRVGLVCRYTKENYYFFIISHDGFYAIGLFQDGQTSLLGQSEMQTHEIINRGTSVNHLRADCVGGTLTFYVNGQKLAEVEDATLTHGDVGLLAGSFSQPGVDILFDNFVAIQP